MRREVTAFRLALAVAALHAVLARGPLSGRLVPAVVAVALLIAYPRLRTGWRATACAVCGVPAVAGGGALHEPLAVAAGAALLGLGAIVLWRAPRARWRRRALHAAGALAGTYFLLLPLGLAVVATHRARSVPAAAALGRPYERVWLHTRDGLRLAAWYVPSRNGAAVIAFPGRRQPVPHARLLAGRGYGVLLLDRRGEGASDGDFNAFGWGGEADLVAALDFLTARGIHRVGGLGLSVGGELLLETAADDPRLRAVVSEGAGERSLREQLHWPGVSAWMRPLSPVAATTAATAVLSGHAPPPDLVDVMRRLRGRPVLLIRALHGHADEELNLVYRRAGAATLWETAAGGHTGALAAAPAAYRAHVLGFLDRVLLAGR